MVRTVSNNYNLSLESRFNTCLTLDSIGKGAIYLASVDLKREKLLQFKIFLQRLSAPFPVGFFIPPFLFTKLLPLLLSTSVNERSFLSVSN